MRYAKIGLFFLLILLVGGMVIAVEDTQIKELNFFEKLFLSFGAEPFAVSITNLNPDPGEIITYTGYGTIPSQVCEAIDFSCGIINPSIGAAFYESCVRPIIVDEAKFNLHKENGDTGSPETNPIKTIDRKQIFGDFIAKKQTELAQQGSSVCGKTYQIDIIQSAPSTPDKYWMFFDWKARNKQMESFFVASLGKSFTVGTEDVGTPTADLVVTFTNSDGTTNTPTNPQTFVVGETKTVKYNTNKAVSIIGCDTPLPSGINLKSVSSFTRTFTFSFDSSAPSEAALICRFDSKPFSLYMKKGTTPIVVPPPPVTPVVVPPPPIPNDSDGDGALDSDDKCPTIAPINYKREKVNVPQRTPDKTDPLYGCPLVEIIRNSVKVLGEPRYAVADRVPIVLSLLKDDNFDLGGLKIEAGIYETDTQFLATFSAISPGSVLGSRNLQEIPACVSGEENVQAADILEISAFAFGSGDNKNEATYILLPKMPGQVALSEKNFAIQATAYKECGKAITSNAQARVTRTIQAQSKHNIFIDPTCVTVSGVGTDECSTPSSSGSGTPTNKKESLTIDELDSATPQQLVASSCSFTAECTAKEGFDVSCKSAESLRVELPQIGIQKAVELITGPLGSKGLCVAEPTSKATFCSFVSPLAFTNFAGDRCTSGSIILFGGLFIIFLLFSFAGGRR